MPFFSTHACMEVSSATAQFTSATTRATSHACVTVIMTLTQANASGTAVHHVISGLIKNGGWRARDEIARHNNNQDGPINNTQNRKVHNTTHVLIMRGTPRHCVVFFKVVTSDCGNLESLLFQSATIALSICLLTTWICLMRPFFHISTLEKSKNHRLYHISTVSCIDYYQPFNVFFSIAFTPSKSLHFCANFLHVSVNSFFVTISGSY